MIETTEIKMNIGPGECEDCSFEYEKTGKEWIGPGTWRYSWECPCCGGEDTTKLRAGAVSMPFTREDAVDEITRAYEKGTLTDNELEKSLDRAFDLEETTDTGGK